MSDESIWSKKSFDAFDEQDLAIVLTQVARRMLQLRVNTPDIGFWHGVLLRVSKMLYSAPALNNEEQRMVRELKAKNQSMIPVIRKLRLRTGLRLKPCHTLIKAWIDTTLKDNNITKASV